MTEAKEAKKEKSALRNVVGKWVAICFTLFVMYSLIVILASYAVAADRAFHSTLSVCI